MPETTNFIKLLESIKEAAFFIFLFIQQLGFSHNLDQIYPNKCDGWCPPSVDKIKVKKVREK